MSGLFKEFKICKDCLESKLPSEFSRDGGATDGLRLYCKSCQKVRFRKWYEKNKEKQISNVLARRDPDRPLDQIKHRTRTQSSKISAFGEVKSFQKWAEDQRAAITAQGMRYRFYTLGFTAEDSISKPRAR